MSDLESSPSRTSPVAAPELLAPAGDAECMQAAIENGADAIYFGLTEHNARARAENFSLENIQEIMRRLRRRNVRGYVTLNTLVFPKELPRLARILLQLAEAGVDAIIVQDLGLAGLAREIAPDLDVHASTQMTLTSAESIDLAERLGVRRVILARELSIAEAARIRRRTSVPLEMFVHGALCVAYSGQCLTSEALGGRSANRGECAQACRLPYELICDGRKVDLDGVEYLLSPQDLAGFDHVARLVEIGIASLKIEGRLKSPEYVANITARYREAIDAAVAGRAGKFSSQAVREMELSFSRGFSTGWLFGNNHKKLVQGRTPKKRGVRLGEVVAVQNGRAAVRLSAPVKRGDGVVFDRGRPEEKEEGGRIYEVFVRGRSATSPVDRGVVELTFRSGAVDWSRVEPGQMLWKTDDPELTRRLRATYQGGRPRRRVAVDFQVRAAVGARLEIYAKADNGAQAAAASDEPLAEAIHRPADENLFREQLDRLGGTVYRLRSIQTSLKDRVMVPLSVLGGVRKRLLEALDASIAEPKPSGAAKRELRTMEDLLAKIPKAIAPSDPPTLAILCRTMRQLAEVLDCGERNVVCDFQDVREYDEATRAARCVGASILLAPPRIQKPAEAPLFRRLLRCGADGVLARNLGSLAFFSGRVSQVVADFSLNASNPLTAQWLREQGAGLVVASYDLDREQLLDLVGSAPPEWFQVVIHQQMPMFHMEHCVFCAFLSPGTDRTNCGRPCDSHDVKLRDRVGKEHPLRADVGCRNTLFNAVPQSAAEAVPSLLARGVRRFRIDLLEESGPAVAKTVGLYRRLLAGQVAAREVWSALNAYNKVGVTRGPLEILH